MKGYIANTDYDWHLFLRDQPDLDEVNFWQPSGRRGFQAVPPGAPFFFKLKKPYYAIAGFGFFARQSILPAWLAWETFGIANGAPDYHSMKTRIMKYRRPTGAKLESQLRIGCLMVVEPVFFGESEWITQPADWRGNIVQGATYDLTLGEGKRIWEQCRLLARSESEAARTRYGEPALVQSRLGQATFRIGVIDAYQRACAVTREHSLPALEAGHIKPSSLGGQHRIANGLLLRSDIHRLFDQGYVTVTPGHRFEVSRRLKEDFENGRSYYPLHGRTIHLPALAEERPDPAALAWHNSERFL